MKIDSSIINQQVVFGDRKKEQQKKNVKISTSGIRSKQANFFVCFYSLNFHFLLNESDASAKER